MVGGAGRGISKRLISQVSYLATCGSGVITAIPSLVQAAMDCSGVVVVAGDAPMGYWDMGVSEEVDIQAGGDQTSLFRAFAKRVYPITVTERVPHMMANAFNCATTGRPGPVLVSLPFELQHELVDVDIPAMDKRRPNSKPTAPADDVRKVAEMLLSAERPVIVAGGGAAISGAWDEVAKVAEFLTAQC